ncbi:hypothetical protein HYW59_01060 [Candidatus Kaiserbacteria bacterium]|nr:hypothetical protein [Candidatus Kaiserbacteria bacterium]
MKIFFIAVGVLVVLAIASIFVLPKPSGTVQSNDPDIVAAGGMHWHPILTMYVKGEKLELPPDMGLGAVHKPMHTHAEDSAQGVIHLEFPGMVRRNDIMLGRFFEIWGKDIGSFGSNMTMMVNGSPSTEYGNFIMHDGDKIELRYD